MSLPWYAVLVANRLYCSCPVAHLVVVSAWWLFLFFSYVKKEKRNQIECCPK